MAGNPKIIPKDRLLVQTATYNTNLQGDSGVPQDLVDWLSPTLQVSNFLAKEPRAPDVVAVGFQELLPLHFGFAGLSKSVIENRNSLLLSQIEAHAPNKEKYSLVAKVVHVGVALLVYILDEHFSRVEDVQTSLTGCGPAYIGNKGAVGVRFRLAGADGGLGETLTFVCAHLTPHEHKLAHRIADYNRIVGSLLFPPIPSSTRQPSTAPTTIYETSHLFFFGDLNFRLDLPESHPLHGSNNYHQLASALDDESKREELKEYDQLRMIQKKGTAFVGLREGEFWKFKCTYKYEIGEVDKYSALRTPSWTDRVLYATYSDDPGTPEKSNITDLLYTSIPGYTTSDHKPVVSLLLLPPPSTSVTPEEIPVLKLPENFKPAIIPYASLKSVIGRILERILGYVLSILTLLGAGSIAIGMGNFILGLSVLTFWRKSAGAASDV